MKNTEIRDWVWNELAVVPSRKDAIDCEVYHIRLWNLYENGLNERTGSGPKTEGRNAASERMAAYRKENPEPWNKGRKGHLSEETRKLMSVAKLKNPSKRAYTAEQRLELSEKYGNKVLCLSTGTIFPSISKAAQFHGLSRESVRDVVNGKRSHTNGLVFEKLNNKHAAADKASD